MGPGGLFISIGLLIALSMFFSLCETAFVSVPEEKFFKKSQEGDKRAKFAMKLLNNKDKVVSVALLCNNVANIAASSLSAVFFAEWFGEYDEWGIVLSTVLMTILIFVFGEVLPKMVAMRQSARITLLVAPLFLALWKFSSPIIWIINKVVGFIVKKLKIHDESDDEDPNESMLGAVEMYHKKGVIQQDEKEMLNGILTLEDVDMKDIMTHRSEMFAVDINEGPEVIISKIMDQQHTKIPVYDKSDDNMIGVLDAVDLYKKIFQQTTKQGDQEEGKNLYENCVISDNLIKQLDIRSMLKEPWYIPGEASISSQLQEFRRRGNALAFIVDEYGGVMGIVTLEDLIEEVVGDIKEENEKEEVLCIKTNDGGYIVMADMNLNDLNDAIDSHFTDAEVSSIGGFVINKIERIPTTNETFEIDGWDFRVIETKSNRIIKLKLKKKEEKVEEE